MIESTEFSISGAGFQPFHSYSTRGIKMTLAPIAAASQLERTINGDLVDLSLNQFHDKYTATVTCDDVESPVFVGLRPGQAVTVTCVPHLAEREDDQSAGLLTLSMFVANWSVQRDEWGAATSWTLELTM